ncbi:MAG: family protein 2 [Betaproteobacteria bacterium]|nr:family protein 2 [Betaproteobacteria bacterium]
MARRFASMLYEGILLFGVVFIPAYLFSALLRFKDTPDSPLRHVFQVYMFAAIGLYFVVCWRRTGQTLPMKTWKFRLFTAASGKPSMARAWLRYSLSWIGPILGVLVYKLVVELTGANPAHFSSIAFWVALPWLLANWLWAWVDRDKQFLHDRLAGTRLLSIA